jgi:hypothetical protein
MFTFSENSVAPPGTIFSWLISRGCYPRLISRNPSGCLLWVLDEGTYIRGEDRLAHARHPSEFESIEVQALDPIGT